MPRKSLLIMVLATVAFGATLGPAFAQSPSEEEIIEALSLRPKTADKITGSRDIRDLIGKTKIRGVFSDEEEDEVPSIDIKVNFSLDSIKLENETILTLKALGNALSSEELAEQQIQIIGHTDARGSDEHNDDLSRRRANAVVAYLVAKFGIHADLITSEGHGEQDLLYPDDPENDLNRRVEVRNITEQE